MADCYAERMVVMRVDLSASQMAVMRAVLRAMNWVDYTVG